MPEIREHRIRRTFSLSALITCLSWPRLLPRAFRMAWVAFRYFFYPQFETAANPRRRPTVNVDHEIDDSLPFLPDLVAEYLTFFFLWINTGEWMARRYGRKGRAAFAELIDEMADWYLLAGSVYLRTQSTTRRPQKAANGGFAVIHGLDPHLHCVPSLHVLVVVGNWLLSERLLLRLEGVSSREALPPPARAALAYTEQEALRITESVLFVKQHSVNCVGASFFSMRAFMPEMTAARENDLLDSLFTYTGGHLDAASVARGHIRELSSKFFSDYSEACARAGVSPDPVVPEGSRRFIPSKIQKLLWKKTLLDWLKSFGYNPPYGGL